jgi:ABC-type polar amino acid transport system ATPase subunit
MVFQQFNLFPHMTVLENAMLGLRVSLNQPRDQAEPYCRELLARMGLSEKLNARPEQLSGGQQQRVAIARTLAVKPEAVLFDEPTSALDPRMSGEVLGVIADLAKQGLTMMVVTHAMGFARKVGNTIHVMHAGRVAESGPPEQIFSDPKTEVTRHFLAEAGAA